MLLIFGIIDEDIEPTIPSPNKMFGGHICAYIVQVFFKNNQDEAILA